MQENLAMFEKFLRVVDKTEERDDSLKTSIIDHLHSFEIEFQRYFHKFKEEEAALLRNTFSTSLVIANILDELQGQFYDIRNDSSARDIFHEMLFFSVLLSCARIIPPTV